MFAIQIFIGRAVALVAIFRSENKDLVAFTVVKATRVGQRMVDFDVTGLKQSVKVDSLYGVGTLALLLSVQLPFLKLTTLGCADDAKLRDKGLFVLFVSLAIGLLFLAYFHSFIERF